jgi:hypothetical protein
MDNEEHTTHIGETLQGMHEEENDDIRRKTHTCVRDVIHHNIILSVYIINLLYG